MRHLKDVPSFLNKLSVGEVLAVPLLLYSLFKIRHLLLRKRIFIDLEKLKIYGAEPIVAARGLMTMLALEEKASSNCGIMLYCYKLH